MAPTDSPPASAAPDLPPLPALTLGRYSHYKGGEYEVLGVARLSETFEPLIVYRPLYNQTGLWVRPYAVFFEFVDIDGVLQPRFAPLKTATAAGYRPESGSPWAMEHTPT